MSKPAKTKASTHCIEGINSRRKFGIFIFELLPLVNEWRNWPTCESA